MPLCTSIAQRTEFDENAVAGALDDAPVMHRDDGVDEIAAQGSQAREDTVLVRACEPAVANDIRNQNRRELPGLAHRALRTATM